MGMLTAHMGTALVQLNMAFWILLLVERWQHPISFWLRKGAEEVYSMYKANHGVCGKHSFRSHQEEPFLLL